MKRRTQPRAAASVSLFPFLAVLLCTMGALIVLLVVIAQQARAQAARAAAAEVQRQDDTTAQTQAQWLAYQRQIGELDERVSALRRQLAERRRATSTLDEQLEQTRFDLRELEGRAGALREKLAGVADENQTEELWRQIGAYRKRIEEVGEEIRRAKHQQPGSAFAIVPYVGPSGTQRRPIYIECRRNCVILQPEGTLLRAADFPTVRGRVPVGNPLESALLATIQHWERSGVASGAKAYPMLLVRPDGIESYEAVLSALGYGSDQQRFEFGYELVEADWDLAFDDANPQLAEQQADAAARAREVIVQRYARQGLRIPSASSGNFADEEDAPPGYGYRVSSEGGGLEAVGRDGLSILSMPDPYGPQGYGPGGDEYGQIDRAFPGSSGPSRGDVSRYGASGARYGGDAAPSFTGGGEGEENPYSLFGGGSGQGGETRAGQSPGSQAGAGGTLNGQLASGDSQFAGGTADRPASGDRYLQGGASGGNPFGADGNAGGGFGSAGTGGDAATPGEAAARSASGGTSLEGPRYSAQSSSTQTGGGRGETASGSGEGSPDAGESGAYVSGGHAATDAASGGSSSATAGSAGSSAVSSGATSSSQTSAPTASGGISTYVEERGQLPAQPLSQERGKDWALQHGKSRSSAIWRYITIVVDDELIWVATGGSGPAAWKAIPYNGATVGAVGTLQRTVLEIMDGWGLAGRGMHWRPVLSAQVTSRGASRYRDLETLLHDSGFTLERKAGPSAYQPGTAEAKE